MNAVSNTPGDPLEPYRQLPEDAAAILELVSVSIRVNNLTTLVKLVSLAALRTSRSTKAFTFTQVKSGLKLLEDSDLVSRTSSQIDVNPIMGDLIVCALAKDDPGKLKRLHNAISANAKQENRYFFDFHTSMEGQLQNVRNIRVAYHLEQPEVLKEAFESHCRSQHQDIFFWQFLDYPFIAEKFLALPGHIRKEAFGCVHHQHLQELIPDDKLLEAVETLEPTPEYLSARAEQLILTGQLQQAAALAEQAARQKAPGFHAIGLYVGGWLAFLAGNDDKAIDLYEQALASSLKGTRKRKGYPFGLSGLFFILALCRRGEPRDIERAKSIHGWGLDLEKSLARDPISAMAPLLNLKLGDEALADQQMAAIAIDLLQSGRPTFFVLLIWLLQFRWVCPDRLKGGELSSVRDYAALLVTPARESGYLWVEAEAIELLLTLEEGEDATLLAKRLKELRDAIDSPTLGLAELVPYQEKWERSLSALESLAYQAEKASPAASPQDKPLMWRLETFDENFAYHPEEYEKLEGLAWRLTPMEQGMLKSGRKGKVRPVSYSKLLKDTASTPYLTEQDRNACNYIRHDYSGRHGRTYDIGNPKALEALVGHPLLFADENATVPIELVLREPELTLSETGQSEIRINLWPRVDYYEEETWLVKDTPSRYLVVPVNKGHIRIADIIPQGGLVLPTASKDRVLKSLAALSSTIRVQSQVAGDSVAAADSVPADPTPMLHLFPQGDGLLVECYVQPIQPDGDHFHPGQGGKVVFARGQDGNLQTTRDLANEQEKADAAIRLCPSLEQSQHCDFPYTWSFADPESSLQLLLDLQQLPDNTIETLWPKGEAFSLRKLLGGDSLKLSLRKQQTDWLEASGELEVDDDLVLGMKDLMRLLEEQSGQKFLKLDDGQFLALTESFRRRLDDLRLQSVSGKDGVRKLHPLAALGLEDLADEARTSSDAAWKEHVEKLKQASAIEPSIPSTLQAELRPYQAEGYQWLARLAEWGAGACLADDMGLGKTIQALALLLHRAAGGPALIVAPTSVAANWVNEALTFAPTLNPIRFAGRQNAALLKKLKARDMVVTTYGMLQQADGPLSDIDWHTVVLDEAQAIKNRTTKRSKAAKKLKAGFRILTTGTPIENHLGELHNLFDFLNPGLLGSAENFQTRFAAPIELNQDARARNSLKRLVQPFILRRLKTEVLQDLPPRTEITLNVEMSPDEAVFYEALRQTAVENLTKEALGETGDGGNSLRIFAEITRLRQACCNPALVQKKGAPESSKLAVFTDTLTEILEGNHKVLVFSQFVSHLSILRKHLDKLGVCYQYLDGSTPAKKRQQSIDAFQNGDGDVFLISLKAGGSGLNLTAADYVIHMDPWWNPAVEDQASDRAHRIGQQRPVTIYRLVTKDSIEEKIVALHHQKRDLADSLLAGTDQAARLTPEDMLKLIQEK